MGLSASRVSTLLKAYYGLRQMFEHREFAQRADAAFFSHFEYAYLKQTVREWLGWDDKRKIYSNEGIFCFFCRQITGATSAQNVLSAREVRDILPIVLQSPSAKAAFLEGASLVEAYSMCSPQAEQLNSFLQNISNFLTLSPQFNKITLTPQNRIQLIKLHNFTASILQDI